MADLDAGATPRIGLFLVSLALGCSSGLEDGGADPDDDGPGCATALLWVDEDLDGFGDAARPEEACVNAPGHSAMVGDCDDTRADVHPAMPEVCNGIDDDCDGEVDMGLLIEVWSDLDGDGFGDPDSYERVCEAEPFHVRDDTDCDDAAAEVHPAAEELCDGIDQNCNGEADEAAVDRVMVFADGDMDGMGAPGEPFLACPDTVGTAANDWDCDDADPITPLVVDAGATGGDGSLTAPLGSIQDAIDAAQAGTSAACVAVLGGRYAEALDVSNDDVSVVGVEGADLTVVDGFGLDAPVLTLGAGNQLDTLVQGLTLTQGTPHREVIELAFTGIRQDYVYDRGAGIYAVDARATLRDLSVVNNLIIDPELPDYTEGSGTPVLVNWLGRGGGLYTEGGTVVVENCLFEGNEAARGGAVYAADTLFVEQTRFWANSATELGGAVAVDDGIVTIENSVFVDNVAPDAASVHANDSTLLLSHLTVYDDFSAQYDGALVVVENVRGLWSNLILSAAAPTGIVVNDEVSVVGLEGVLFDRLDTAYDAYFRSLRVSGELSGLDPRFINASSDGDPSNDDLHLQADSPAVDAGTSGRDPDGSAPDLGAYGGPLGSW